MIRFVLAPHRLRPGADVVADHRDRGAHRSRASSDSRLSAQRHRRGDRGSPAVLEMTEPVFFVVERRHGQEEPAIYTDRLPENLTRKIPKDSAERHPLVYALRLDKMPDLDKWLAAPLKQLYRTYCALRDAGKLPPSNLADPPMKSTGTKGVLRGEFWAPPARTWEDRPADPFPSPGDLQLNSGAGAFISEKQADCIEPPPDSTELPNREGAVSSVRIPPPEPRPPLAEDDGRGVFLGLPGKSP